jgi:opacity protein-like surface antigen
MKIKTLLVLSFMLCISSDFFAQSISLGPQLGFAKSTDADQTSLMPGVAARLSLLSFGIEGAIYYKSENFENSAVKTTSYPVNITLLWKILPLIHAEGGIGWYSTKIDDSNPIDKVRNETKNNAGYHLGAGLELPLSGIVLTADIRYVFLNIGSVANVKSDFTVVFIGALFTL